MSEQPQLSERGRSSLTEKNRNKKNNPTKQDPTTRKRYPMGQFTSTTTDQTFKADVLDSDKPVLVDFWAEWCGPCRMVGPILEEIASENADKISVVKLNVDQNPQTAANYGVVSIPTLNVFQGGKVVKQIVGAKPKKALEKDLAEFL